MTMIELRALVGRAGRLLFVRETTSEMWGLPGGTLDESAEDIDAAMESMLRGLGIVPENIAEDFLKTTYLPDKEGQVVLNLYAPMTWQGEPVAAPGQLLAWLSFEEMVGQPMADGLHAAILQAFGMGDDRDEDEAILAGIGALTAPTRPPSPDRRAAGLDVLRTLGGADPVAAAEGLERRTPGLGSDIIDFALGEVWSHPALDRKTRSLQVVAMLAAMGGKAGPLRSHMNGALNHGATPEQLAQTLRMVAVYAGFPAALEAWPVMDDVLKARGVTREGSP